MFSQKFIFPFFLFLFYCSFLNSQTLPENWKCGVTESVINPLNYSYKPFQTPVLGQPFKIMIVYVTFANDNAVPVGHDFWDDPEEIPQSPRPGGGSILAIQDVPYNSDFMNMYPEYSISDYFCEMSMGKFDVVGDEYIVNLEESDEYYRNFLGDRERMNYYVLKYKVDQELNVDFTEYDNWAFNPATQE